MNQNEILDLDSVAPESKQVKLNNKTYEVKPANMRQILRLQKLYLRLKNGTEDQQLQSIEEMEKSLEEIVPGINGADLSEVQLYALIEFVYHNSTPQNPETGNTQKKIPVKNQ